MWTIYRRREAKQHSSTCSAAFELSASSTKPEAFLMMWTQFFTMTSGFFNLSNFLCRSCSSAQVQPSVCISKERWLVMEYFQLCRNQEAASKLLWRFSPLSRHTNVKRNRNFFSKTASRLFVIPHNQSVGLAQLFALWDFPANSCEAAPGRENLLSKTVTRLDDL